MSSGSLRGAVRNYVAGFLFTAVTMAVGFLSTPLLVSWLGGEEFGLYRACVDLFGMVLLVEFGLVGGLRPLFARTASASGSGHSMWPVLAFGLRKAVWPMAAAVAIGLVIAFWVETLFRCPPSLVGDLKLAWLVCIVGAVSIPAAVCQLFLEAKNEGFLVSLGLTVQSVLGTGVAVCSAALGGGIIGQVSGGACAAVVGSVYVGSLVIRRLRGRSPESHPPDAALEDELRAHRTPTVVVQVCGRIGLLGDSLIVAALLGPAAVASLFVTQRLALIIQGLLEMVGSASWPTLAGLHHNGEAALFGERLSQLTRLVAVLGVVTVTPVVGLGERFVSVWVGSDQFAGATVVVFACANAVLVSIVSLWGWPFGALGRIRELAPITLRATVVNVIFSFALVGVCGVAGPIVGTTVALVGVQLWAVPKLLSRTFGVNSRDLLRQLVLPLGFGLVMCAFAALVSRLSWNWGWLELALGGLTSLAFNCSVSWLALLSRQERDLIRARVRSTLPSWVSQEPPA